MKKVILFLFLLIAITPANAQTLIEKLKVAFNKFASDEQLKYASVSFSVLNTETGALIFGGNENLGVAPASTLKTITSATALALLGEDFTYKTQVSYSGNIENEILKGDLIISGSGDPTLGSWRWKSTSKEVVLNKILFGLQQFGIKSIEGKIIGDDGLWDTQSLPIGWIWQDLGNYYGAGSSALSWGENQFELNFQPSKTTGGLVNIKNKEEIYPFLDIKNELKTGSAGSGDNVYAYSAPYTSTIYLRGTYGIDLVKKIGLSLPDAAFAMAYEVAEFLKKNSINSVGFTTARLADKNEFNNTKLITEIVSPPLKEIVYWFNQKSVNLYGEQLIRTLGMKFGISASTVDGVKTVQDYWKTKGIAPETLNIVDGSGLSPADRITTLSMAQVLYHTKKEKWFNTYLESLPTNNGLKMKSGSIADVLGYAGYSTTINKQSLCFSIVINNYTGSSSAVKKKMFTLLNHLK